jgi:hypothetical protein
MGRVFHYPSWVAQQSLHPPRSLQQPARSLFAVLPFFLHHRFHFPASPVFVSPRSIPRCQRTRCESL